MYKVVPRLLQVAATYVLILTPTRELAVQVHSMVTSLAQHTDISAALVVGGLSQQVKLAPATGVRGPLCELLGI